LTDLSASSFLNPYRAVAAGLRGQWLLLQNDLGGGILIVTPDMIRMSKSRRWITARSGVIWAVKPLSKNIHVPFLFES
jgi:hypothetical protein